MIQILKSNAFLSIASYILLCFIFLQINLFWGTDTSRYHFNLWGEVPAPHLVWIKILTLIFTLFNAFLVNRLFNIHDFYDKNTFLSGFIYLMFVLSSSILQTPTTVIAHFFAISSLGIILSFSQHEEAKKPIFNAAFLMTLAVCISPTLMPMLFFPIFALWSNRVFIFREFILFLLGIAVPAVYLFSFFYFFPRFYEQFSSGIIPFSFQAKFSSLIWLFVGLIFVSLVFISAIILKKIRSSSIRFKQINKTMWLMFFVALLADLLTFLENQNIIFISAIPMCVLFATGGLSLRKTFFFNVLLIAMLVTLLCVRWVM